MSWTELQVFWAEHPLGRATIAVGVGLVAAVVIRLVLGGMATRLAVRTRNTVDDELMEILIGPLSISVLLGSCWFAATTVELHGSALFSIRGVLGTLAVLYWSAAINRAIGVALGAVSALPDHWSLVQPRTLPAFRITARAVVLGGSIYFLLLAWKVDVTGWLASAGIVGIAVGFAAKDTLSNLFAGVFIIADAPYQLGDYLVLESGERGRVTHIGFRSTRLLTRDDIEIIAPNAQMANVRIINESGGPHEKERVRCKVSVAYGSDVDRVREVLMSCVDAHPEIILDDPKINPRVRFRRFGESGLDFELMAWIAIPEARGRTLDALNTKVYKRLNEEGIEIPYPKLDVYLRGGGGGAG